ncbi:MAG: glycosyltransferase family 39 protein [Anaerolineae bacterium]|nr:glycosyltransferase family 39 protein [Anaerolineae bacterium]
MKQLFVKKISVIQDRYDLIVIFGAALGLRLLYLFLKPQPPIVYDALGYFELGRSLVMGATSELLQPWGADIWPLLSSRGPIYALFLAGNFFIFDVDPWPVRYIQAVLDALSCVFVYLIGKELVNRYVGLISGFLMVLYLPFILFTGRMLTETLANFLFWTGMFLLVRGLRCKGLNWLVASGLMIGLACLARPTLLPGVPFFIVAVGIGLQEITWRRRIILTGIFGVSLVGLLFIWYVVAKTVNSSPTIGVAGIDFMMSEFSMETNPLVRGWRPDYRQTIDLYWWQNETSSLKFIYIIAAVINLIFYHFWFAENAWRESFLLSPTAMHWAQQILLGLGLGGVGIALIRWRTFAPLFAVLVTFCLVSVKVIEVRHNLPFMPAIFLFAGLFIVYLFEWIKNYFGWTKDIVVLVVGIILVGVILIGSRLLVLFSSEIFWLWIQPVTLGIAGDLAVVIFSLLVGGLVFRLSTPAWGRLSAAVAGFVPAVLLIILISSYAYINSGPRWWAWNISLNQTNQVVRQEIQLPAPISEDKLELVIWLVDLQANAAPPPLQVRVNESLLSPQEYSWQRLFCAQKVLFVTNVEQTYCPVYEEYMKFAHRPMTTWPQWWGLVIDPALLLDKNNLSLTLSQLDPTVESNVASQVKLGGTFAVADSQVVYGPSVYALSPGARTSIYRWLLIGDWRLWETSELASVATHSYLIRSDAADILLKANLNIRLAVKYKDGRIVIY